MSKTFMPEVTDLRQKRIILQENADSVEETTYFKPLSEDELNDKKTTLTENSIQLADLDEEKKELVKKFKDKIDPIKEENKLLMAEIRSRQTRVKGNLYNMADHANGIMETYDEDGNFIGSRRLKPEERQARVPFLSAVNE